MYKPQDLGHQSTITFYNDWDKFDWSKSNDPCDVRSGVICSPNNFDYGDGSLAEGTMRITALANFEYWKGLSEHDYSLEKITLV